ncbi:Uncharacterized protein Adt_47952 [Abeliophyllum distichum]|uniref:RNase H type-1 domain-containing protein n=1 Tax=Abeliophyllum distichum TaxID=126358 RepID=A0ABD1NT55_9LAMI
MKRKTFAMLNRNKKKKKSSNRRKKKKKKKKLKNNQGGGPWHIQATLRHIRHLLALDRDTITHIFREGNQVADLLASEGWDRRYYYEYSSQDLPRRHRSLVQIDRFGLPTVRGL